MVVFSSRKKPTQSWMAWRHLRGFSTAHVRARHNLFFRTMMQSGCAVHTDCHCCMVSVMLNERFWNARAKESWMILRSLWLGTLNRMVKRVCFITCSRFLVHCRETMMPTTMSHIRSTTCSRFSVAVTRMWNVATRILSCAGFACHEENHSPVIESPWHAAFRRYSSCSRCRASPTHAHTHTHTALVWLSLNFLFLA